MIDRSYPGEPAVILGTGPSLGQAIPRLRELRAAGRVRLFGMNCTYQDFPVLDGFIACDPKWWDTYGHDFRERHPDTPAWHWDRDVARKYRVQFIEGRWGDGLSTDPSFIHYGHSSGYQAIGLAVHHGCEPIVLAGFDMRYEGRRHYFSGLSDTPGEYPEHLRKFSTFDGLLKCYETIVRQPDRPVIVNATPGSALKGFPCSTLEELFQ